MHQFAAILLLAISTAAVDPDTLQKLATCRRALCLEDAYYTVHAPPRALRFFYHARMLQLFPHNRQSEAGLLTTIPRSEEEAKALTTMCRTELHGARAIERRDSICSNLSRTYWSAASRNRGAIPRLLKAAEWMGERFQCDIKERCATKPDLCH